MRLHTDTSATRYTATGAPTPVLDRETRTQRVDDQGRPLYTVSLRAISPDGPEIHDVKFAGDTKGLEEMTPVTVTKLVASPWSIGDRNGISFRAEGAAVGEDRDVAESPARGPGCVRSRAPMGFMKMTWPGVEKGDDAGRLLRFDRGSDRR